MLRIFTSRCGHLLMKLKLGPPQGGMSSLLDTPSVRVSRFCTRISAENDEAGMKSKETEAVDLDKWKSVMMSQATFQVQRVGGEAEPAEDVDDLKPAGGGSNGGSSLEATRELVSMWRLAGKLVPQQLSDEELQTVANLPTKTSRKKYLKYLAIGESLRLNRLKKQQQKAAEREAALKEKREAEGGEDDDDGCRLKAKNTLFLQFWDRSLDRLQSWRVASAMMFGQPLVFDMSYDNMMSRRELENTVSQLLKVEGLNRRSVDPFHLHYCNLQPGGPYERELLKQYGAEAWEHQLITATERRHVDLFPRKQLVYLTADSPNVLRAFDRTKVYIVGAMVDRSVQACVSLANAKRLGLDTARLPLDEFLHWDIGNKNLTLNQMISILLSIRDTGSWKEALEFVPKRKHDGFNERRTESKSFASRARREDRDEGLAFKNRNVFKEFAGRKDAETTRVRAPFKTNAGPRTNSYSRWWQDE